MTVSFRSFFVLSIVGFVAACIIGVLGALRLVLPWESWEFLSFVRLRPLHTFLAIASMLSGIVGLLHLCLARVDRPIGGVALWIQFVSLVSFFGIGAVSLWLGWGSGREYISWSAPVATLVLLPLLLALFQTWGSRGALAKHSPEGTWLLGLGFGLLCLGLLESYLWLLPAVGGQFVRDLTVQWHGIDAFIAGLNVSLYGASMFLMDKSARALRTPALLVVATFSLLFTFGHHHYASPQPSYLKVLAFVASMLAITSFVRHSRAYLASAAARRSQDGVVCLMRSVQLWTIVSLLSGILFAVPQLNVFLHGTHLVVVHAMGSMIGISLIIYMGVFCSSDSQMDHAVASRVRWSVRGINFSLVALWLALGVGGVYKGVARIEMDYLLFAPRLVWMYGAFAVVGGILAVSMIGLSAQALAFLARRGREAAARESFGTARSETSLGVSDASLVAREVAEH